jgi:hypothetical protein
MNEHARKVLERAYELLDRREERKREFKQWRDRHAEQIEADEVDELLRRSHPEQLMFKTKEGALVSKPSRLVYKTTTTERPKPASLAHLERFAAILGEEVAEIENALRKEIASLRREVEALRAELEALSKSNVTPMRGHRVA